MENILLEFLMSLYLTMLSLHYLLIILIMGRDIYSILPQTDSKVIYRSSEKIKNIKNTTTRNPKKRVKKYFISLLLIL